MEAAFFDLDKTIIARSSALVFGKPFYKEGLISRTHIVKGMYAQLVYHLVGADENKMERMRAALLELTKGWDKVRVSELVRETLTELIDPIIFEDPPTSSRSRSFSRRKFACSSAFFKASSTLSRPRGFSRKSNAPERVASTASAIVAWPEIMIAGAPFSP